MPCLPNAKGAGITRKLEGFVWLGFFKPRWGRRPIATWVKCLNSSLDSNRGTYISTLYLLKETVGLFPSFPKYKRFFPALVLAFSPSILLSTSGPHWPTGRPL